jgi:hypothetical protein
MPLEPKAWHIIAETQRGGRQANSRPHFEYFVVAIAEPHRALESLRMRKNVADAKLTMIGEATPEFIVSTNIQEGEIRSLAVT